MPADAKPLFRPDVLHGHVKAFVLPPALDALRGDLARWAELVGSGRIDQFKETELLPEFVTLFFNRVLGYRGASDGGAAWTLSHQRHVEVESEFADAVLGRFATEQVARDEATLARFVFLLGADRVVPESGRCHLADLAEESERVGRELTRTFYDAYDGSWNTTSTASISTRRRSKSAA